MITSAEVIKLLVIGIANIRASDLLSECKKMSMQQVPYRDVAFDSNLPTFDAGYHLHFNPDGIEDALFEILQKDEFVLQAGYQLVLQKVQNRYQQIKKILDSHYGVGFPMKVREMEIINYGNEIVAYRNSQHGVFSKEAGIGRYWDQIKHYVWIYRHGTINCVQRVAFKAHSMKSESKIYLEATIKVG